MDRPPAPGAPGAGPTGAGEGRLTGSLDLPATLWAPAAARRAARAVLHAWGVTDPGTHDVVELVVTELVTNAVRYAGAPDLPRLHLEAGEELLVAVSDGSSIPLVLREFTETAESGRGLGIIEALSITWGIEDWHGGKRVWVRIPVRSEPAPGALRPGARQMVTDLPDGDPTTA